MEIERRKVGEQKAVRDLDLAVRGVDRAEFDILIQPLHFPDLRAFRPVGKQQTVAAEVAVVRPFAAVAAVADIAGAVFCRQPDGLIDEVPDERAEKAGVGVKQTHVFVVATAGIAHRVGIFAEHERLFGVRLHKGLDVPRARVHHRPDVGDVLIDLEVAPDGFVMHRAGGILFLEIGVHLLEVVAGVTFVAERPKEDARVVLVALIQTLDPVHADAFPLRLAAGQQRRHPRRGAAGAVGLEIVFVDHIQAVFVAKRVPVGVVRIVRGAHGVDVVALHRQDVLDHRLAVDRAAGVAGELVAVRALEQQTAAVETDHAVLDLDPAEAGADGRAFQRFARFTAQQHQHRIEYGILRGPEPDERDRGAQRHTGFARSRNGIERDGRAVRVIDRHFHFGLGIRSVQRHVRAQQTVAQKRIRFGTDREVGDVLRRARRQIDVAADSGEAEEILVLQPTAGAPAINFDGNQVVARTQHVRDVEFAATERAFAVADGFAVDIEIKAGFHALKREDRMTVQQRGVDRDRFAVQADAVGLCRRKGRHERLVALPRILDIAVLRLSVAFHLP